jgi:hypothetical protein
MVVVMAMMTMIPNWSKIRDLKNSHRGKNRGKQHKPCGEKQGDKTAQTPCGG